MLRPLEDANHGRGLLEHAVQLLALAGGLGVGGLLGGLAFAQDLLGSRAGLVDRVGEADDEQLAVALGRQVEVVVEAVVLVVDVVAAHSARLERVAVKGEDAGIDRAGV